MELAKYTQPARAWLNWSDVTSLTAGSDLQVRTKLQGGGWVEILEDTVPDGKVWEVQFNVHVDETDPLP
jgi:hypothetical protein